MEKSCVAEIVTIILVLIFSLQVQGRAECEAVGVEDIEEIPDGRMTSNASLSSFYAPYYGRLYSNRGGKSWCPSFIDRSEYLQVDMGAARSVCAVATHAYYETYFYATTYYLQFSLDGVTWNIYKESNTKKHFATSTIQGNVERVLIDHGVKARFVRFYPIYPEETWGCLNVEIYVEIDKLHGGRKFFVSDITSNVPYDTINWNNESTTAGFVRVLAPAGAVVTRIGLSNNSQSFTSYHQETVPSNGIVCMPSLRNEQAVMQAELDGAPLEPQQPRNLPPVLNPQILSKNIPSHPFRSFQFLSSTAGSTGPVYARREKSRCQQRDSGDLAFEFQQAGPAETFQWESSRENNPRSARFWNGMFPDICFIKALVTGSRPDTVIYVKSTGKAPGKEQLDYGYTAEKSTRLNNNESVACLEYRCNGDSSAYQTHLQFITLTGSCQITRLNRVLRRAQDGCTVTPDTDSSQESNFCVPDIIGGAAGLYGGDPGSAKFRCLIGDNNYSGSSPTPTNANPTVRLTCS